MVAEKLFHDEQGFNLIGRGTEVSKWNRKDWHPLSGTVMHGTDTLVLTIEKTPESYVPTYHKMVEIKNLDQVFVLKTGMQVTRIELKNSLVETIGEAAVRVI